MDTLILGFQQLQSMWLLIALLSGAVLGVILGAIPGLGPAVGIAILLPATFQMEALNALTLLLGVYCGSWYGGGNSRYFNQYARNGGECVDHL